MSWRRIAAVAPVRRRAAPRRRNPCRPRTSAASTGALAVQRLIVVPTRQRRDVRAGCARTRRASCRAAPSSRSSSRRARSPRDRAGSARDRCRPRRPPECPGMRVLVDPVRHDARPARLRADRTSSSAKRSTLSVSVSRSALTRLLRLKRPCMSSSAPRTSPPSTGSGGKRLRPGLAEVVEVLRVLEVVLQHLGRPGLGAERDVPALVERDEPRGAAQVERRARADVHGEHGRDRDQHDGRDQGDAALPHPGTSTRRRISP